MTLRDRCEMDNPRVPGFHDSEDFGHTSRLYGVIVSGRLNIVKASKASKPPLSLKSPTALKRKTHPRVPKAQNLF